MAITRAAAACGVIQMMPTLASCTLGEMLAAKAPSQVQFYQLYVNSNRSVSERLVRQAEAGGCKALCVTVDAPCLGRREKVCCMFSPGVLCTALRSVACTLTPGATQDLAHKFTLAGSSVQSEDDAAGKVDRSQGTARAISTFIDPSLSWSDVKWLRSITSMKLILKGVQTAEDALLAAKHGLDGIIVSNHGGRQVDCTPSGIEMLAEITDALRTAGLQNSMAIMMDGGVRRGSDVFKAIAMGACAVGIGRPVLYGLAAYGQAVRFKPLWLLLSGLLMRPALSPISWLTLFQGVERVLQLFKDEFEMCMRLMGCLRVSDIGRQHLSYRSLTSHSSPPTDHLYSSVYEPLRSKL